MSLNVLYDVKKAVKGGIDLDKYLTPEQVAERLQVSVITVKRWLTAGKIPGYKVGRQWRIPENELETWVKKDGQQLKDDHKND